MTDEEKNEDPKIFVDEDWKQKAEAEKKALEEEFASQAEESAEAPAEGGVLREETMRGLEALAEAQPVPEEETEESEEENEETDEEYRRKFQAAKDFYRQLQSTEQQRDDGDEMEASRDEQEPPDDTIDSPDVAWEPKEGGEREEARCVECGVIQCYCY